MLCEGASHLRISRSVAMAPGAHTAEGWRTQAQWQDCLSSVGRKGEMRDNCSEGMRNEEKGDRQAFRKTQP